MTVSGTAFLQSINGTRCQQATSSQSEQLSERRRPISALTVAALAVGQVSCFTRPPIGRLSPLRKSDRYRDGLQLAEAREVVATLPMRRSIWNAWNVTPVGVPHTGHTRDHTRTTRPTVVQRYRQPCGREFIQCFAVLRLGGVKNLPWTSLEFCPGTESGCAHSLRVVAAAGICTGLKSTGVAACHRIGRVLKVYSAHRRPSCFTG